MGYCASGYGCIDFLNPVSENRKEEIRKILEEAFDCDFNIASKSDGGNFSTTYKSVDIYSYDKYHEDDVTEALGKLSRAAPVLPGSCVEFVGEDDAHWRFLYTGGDVWREQNGHVVYDD